jgi:hypothetical protein
MGNFDDFSKDQNPYFDVSSPAYDNDKNLMAVMVNEVFNKFGVCMEYYITTYDTNYDRVWGEDNNRFYIRNFEFMGKYELPREDKIWSKFGIEGSDEVTIWISKRHFTAASIDPNNGISYVRPQIGDIIKADFSNYFYEITEVAEDTGQYFQSNQFIWELSVRTMKDENISTSPELSASDIASVTNLNDIFNIDNSVDVEKEPILYKPQKGEKPKEDPFGNW